jgi:predicted enzyme related to lactoylglutathione lyase
MRGVATVWMPVSDLGRALPFYRDALGLEVAKQDAEQWAEVKADGLTIGLNAREAAGAGDGGPVITFRPDQRLEEAMEDLKGRGVEFATGISEHPWGRVATFKDPDGNNLQLYEPPS